ncbi:hypothetical protein ANN_20282 [Periplaneta americana]|uniref:Uncharacterized protein n=1 Tax=Periplaneta americana TaxID=6978 RepID=A0ABQ8SCG0_PERAM|nr:hypothetical protein ANN_20282 [Periplaneta americana]
MLRKIFGAKRDEVTGEWRKSHNTELHAFYSSPDIIRNIKSRRLRWAGHVARMGKSKNSYSVGASPPPPRMASTNSELPPSAASRVVFEGFTTAPYRGMHAIARFTSVSIVSDPRYDERLLWPQVPPIVPCLIVAGGCNKEGCKALVLTEMKNDSNCILPWLNGTNHFSALYRVNSP